jgi:hypothetical protein
MAWMSYLAPASVFSSTSTCKKCDGGCVCCSEMCRPVAAHEGGGQAAGAERRQGQPLLHGLGSVHKAKSSKMLALRQLGPQARIANTAGAGTAAAAAAECLYSLGPAAARKSRLPPPKLTCCYASVVAALTAAATAATNAHAAFLWPPASPTATPELAAAPNPCCCGCHCCAAVATTAVIPPSPRMVLCTQSQPFHPTSVPRRDHPNTHAHLDEDDIVGKLGGPLLHLGGNGPARAAPGTAAACGCERRRRQERRSTLGLQWWARAGSFQAAATRAGPSLPRLSSLVGILSG